MDNQGSGQTPRVTGMGTGRPGNTRNPCLPTTYILQKRCKIYFIASYYPMFIVNYLLSQPGLYYVCLGNWSLHGFIKDIDVETTAQLTKRSLKMDGTQYYCRFN